MTTGAPAQPAPRLPTGVMLVLADTLPAARGVDSVLALIDGVVQPLEDARPELTALRRREVAPDRPGDAGSKDDPGEEAGVAAACGQTAAAAISRIRGIVDARREVGAGEWNTPRSGASGAWCAASRTGREVLDEDGPAAARQDRGGAGGPEGAR